jgi:hypothetical protein
MADKHYKGIGEWYAQAKAAEKANKPPAETPKNPPPSQEKGTKKGAH